jgi:tetraacyldisaccharide 4'-kinase
MENIHTIFSRIIERDQKSLWLLPLYVTAFIYGGAVSLRNILYDHNILPEKKVETTVISIGNITMGGTGKTPTVITLARLLRKHGYRPAVVSRGYGGKSRNPVNIVSDGKTVLMHPREAGDEPVLIARSLPAIPVVTGRNRYVAAKHALKEFDIDLIILDDALQHRALFRNIDILLLDADRPFGNGLLIPGGMLREPTGSVKRAGIVIMTSAAEQSASSVPHIIEKDFPKKPVFTGYRKATAVMKGLSKTILSTNYLYGKRIFAFSGIARPNNFLETLTSLGGIIAGTLVFSDHHAYKREDLTNITDGAATSRAEIIVTTEKDFIKLVDFDDFLRDIFVLRITMEVTPKKAFEQCILTQLAQA